MHDGRRIPLHGLGAPELAKDRRPRLVGAAARATRAAGSAPRGLWRAGADRARRRRSQLVNDRRVPGWVHGEQMRRRPSLPTRRAARRARPSARLGAIDLYTADRISGCTVPAGTSGVRIPASASRGGVGRRLGLQLGQLRRQVGSPRPPGSPARGRAAPPPAPLA